MDKQEPRKRGYPLGHRQKRRITPSHDKMDDNKIAWCKTDLGMFLVMTEAEAEDGHSGEPIKINYTRMPGKGVTWDLTNLTEEELRALRDLWNSAFEWALPIVQLRDKEAQDAIDAGDDSFYRIYRAVPQLVYRKRPVREYSESLFDRPEDAPSVGREETPEHGDGVRDDGSILAERDSSGSQPEDNWPATHQPPGVL